MADSDTNVPFNKCPRVDESSGGKHIPILPRRSWATADEWVGTADEIVAAGLVGRDQLPGEPGNNKVRATYYRGNLVGKGVSAPIDENFLCVERCGKTRFIVRKGVSNREVQRRETRERLQEKSPDIEFNSLPPSLFFIGEKVVVDSVCVKVVDIRYDKGYVYKIDPSPDLNHDWRVENRLYKYVEKLASVIVLPGAALEPVQQQRRPGRLPKAIASFWDAKYKRGCRDDELKKLREKLRQLNLMVDVGREIIRNQQADLIEVKGQIKELLR